jgi:hypothetical protein
VRFAKRISVHYSKKKNIQKNLLMKPGFKLVSKTLGGNIFNPGAEFNMWMGGLSRSFMDCLAQSKKIETCPNFIQDLTNIEKIVDALCVYLMCQSVTNYTKVMIIALR